MLRRDTLNTGGPVPSDLAGNEPAPGETVAGDASNTVEATVTSSDEDANGDPLTASDDADATVHYAHATNAVQIRKAPEGLTKAPGSAFPYTITVQNTGNVDITNPVLTDVFPADADGPQIELAAEPNYTFSYDGDAGDIPVDTTDVTVTQSTDADGNVTGVVFTFPPGSTIAIGKTYTVVFSVVTRPGLAAGTEFTNTTDVVGDRPWDACDNGDSNQVETDGSCRTDATNTVSSAGAVAVVKQVKAEGSDTLGVVYDPGVTTPLPCLADAEGFYKRPCIPIAQPGGDITWRWHFVNTGNLPLDRILGIDRLPTAENDQIATAPLGRGSQWAPVLTGARPTLAHGQGGTLVVYYTTATSGWCDAPQPLDNSDALLCDGTGGQGNLNWQAWPAGQTLADLGVAPADVTGLQIAFEMDASLAPADTFDVDVPMTAPAYSPADTPNTTGMSDANTYAFNTVGTTARVAPTGSGLRADGVPALSTRARAQLAVAAAGGSLPGEYTLTTEPPRVGVGLAHGGFTMVKHLAGDAADESWVPDSFPVTVSCTSDGVDVPLPDEVASQTLTPNHPVSVYDVPWHATCTVDETDSAGQTSDDAPQSVTVQQDPDDFEVARLTNTYEYASLAITKTVDTDAVDQDGNPIPYGPFTVRADCTFLGNPVYAEGFGPDPDDPSTIRPMEAVIADGATVTFTHLPAGASCTISETDDKGAVTTTIETTVGDNDPSADNPIELAPDGENGDTQNSAAITNSFDVGRVALRKEVTGDAAEAYGSGPFILHMTCELDDDSGTRTTWDGDVTLGGGAPLSATVVNIAAGSTCTVTETDDGGASTVTISPRRPISVDANETATVTVTNSFDPAKLFVDKEVDGAAADYAPDSFPIEVTCSANGAVLPGFPVTVDVTPGTPAEVDTLVGATCSAIETDTGQATQVTYDPPQTGDGDGSGDVVIPPTTGEPAPEPATITVTNTYRAGALQILKQLSGPGAAVAPGPFVFDVTCAFNGDDQAFHQTVTLERSGTDDSLASDPISPLPVGAVCTVTETDSGGADSIPDPVTVTIVDVDDAGDPQTVVAAMVNPFSAGQLQVTKALTGDGAEAHAADVFTVDVTCQLELHSDRLDVYSGQVQVTGGQTVPVTNAAGDPVLLPGGTHCWAEETDDGGAESSSVDFDSYDNAAVVEVGQDTVQTLTITVTNAFPAVPTTATVTPTSATTVPPTTPPTNPPLPNTGAPITAQLWWAALLLAVGGALLAVGRTRLRARGKHS